MVTAATSFKNQTGTYSVRNQREAKVYQAGNKPALDWRSYVAGKKDGYVEGSKAVEALIVKGLQDNANKAMNLSAELFNSLVADGIQPVAMRMKIMNFDEFKFAILLPTEVYYSDSRRAVTDKMIAFEEKHSNDLFCIQFMSLPNKKEFNLQALISDGYYLEFANTHEWAGGKKTLACNS